MAKYYYQQLNDLLERLSCKNIVTSSVEVRHFFSGAALYVNGLMCVSLSPVGLAFKFDELEASRLIASGEARPLKYFPKGNIKKGYALFVSPELKNLKKWNKYFTKAFRYVDKQQKGG